MRTFYKGAAAAIIVYDITSLKSFENIEKEVKNMSTWPEMIEEYTTNDIISMLIGNKADL